MKRRVTVREIGRRAGVSHTTAAYVLGGKGAAAGISERTQAHVQTVAQELGWRPNQLVSAFFNGKTRLIGAWFSDLGPPYHAAVMSALEAVLRQDDYAMLLSPAQANQPPPKYDLSLFTKWAADGLIGLDGPQHLRRFCDLHPRWVMPTVSIGSFALRDHPRVDSVYVDVLSPIREQLSAWQAGGRTRIAMLSGHDPSSALDCPREDCYRSFMQAQGAQEEFIRFTHGSSQRGSAEQALDAYVDAAPSLPEAIFCRSDETLMGCYKALRKRGVKIPDEIALLGVDGIAEVQYLESPVATVVQPIKEMAETAWAVLRERMEHPGQPAQHVTLTGRLELEMGGYGTLSREHITSDGVAHRSESEPVTRGTAE